MILSVAFFLKTPSQTGNVISDFVEVGETGILKVEILKGEFEGKFGWIPSEWIVK